MLSIVLVTSSLKYLIPSIVSNHLLMFEIAILSHFFLIVPKSYLPLQKGPPFPHLRFFLCSRQFAYCLCNYLPPLQIAKQRFEVNKTANKLPSAFFAFHCYFVFCFRTTIFLFGFLLAKGAKLSLESIRVISASFLLF